MNPKWKTRIYLLMTHDDDDDDDDDGSLELTTTSKIHHEQGHWDVELDRYYCHVGSYPCC